jgi:DNA-binding MarR family transcriptional regulator/DNA-binding CsgD family transcriptional regulator
MASQTAMADARAFAVLDIDEAEERAYRWLLTHPGATVQEVGEALRLSPRKTQRLLDAIEVKGLATYSPQRPRRYVPASPHVAIEALALRREEDIQRARALGRELQELVAAQRGGEQEPVVEMVTSHEAERQINEQIDRIAQQEVVSLVRLPLLISRLDQPNQQGQRTQREAQARGVRYRSIVDAEILTVPGAIKGIRSDMRAGENVRVLPELPFKMVLADRRAAFIPLNLDDSGTPSLLLRSSALLDALHALFELLWERAAPIAFPRGGGIRIGKPEAQLREDAHELVTLMAAGLQDKAIAHELGVSASTLNRRVVEAMKALEARTRFQLGWLAALRLSGTTDDDKDAP